MAMQVGHSQEVNVSGTQARGQCEWDTVKMTMQVGHRQVVDASGGTQARFNVVRCIRNFYLIHYNDDES